MNITISHHFQNISANLESDLKKLIQYNIDHKLDVYLKSHHVDAECAMQVAVQKLKQTLYIGSLNANIDGQRYNFHVDNDTPFKNPEDLVSHLFTHLKEQISKKKS